MPSNVDLTGLEASWCDTKARGALKKELLRPFTGKVIFLSDQREFFNRIDRLQPSSSLKFKIGLGLLCGDKLSFFLKQ
jgi:hypothetical protein